jgi:nucleoside-diphosphate kinase
MCAAPSLASPHCWLQRAGAGLALASAPAQAFSKPNNKERTYIMIKPDGVQRGLTGAIISRFEAKGYKLVALKMASPTKAHLEAHYADLAKKPFFPSLIDYMLAGPVVCMVWEGSHAVKIGRVILGETNPSDSTPGSIRGDYCASCMPQLQPRVHPHLLQSSSAMRTLCCCAGIEVGRNICHGSDAVESAEAEIALWFPEGLNSFDSCAKPWVTEF